MIDALEEKLREATDELIDQDKPLTEVRECSKKLKESILGLPHTEEGYEEAKAILVQTYGKDVKVHKALIRELESPPISTASNS